MLVYDLIIIGAGPAGITAAVYAARKRMNFLVLTGDVGGQAGLSGDIENYTGYQFITGPDLVGKFEQHMKAYRIEVRENEAAVDLARGEKGLLSVKTAKGQYLARTLIVASGKRSRELGITGEKEFKNHGLSYCATCDGPLFADKDVAVVGGGNSALDAVLQLVRIASQVYLINNTSQLGGDAIMRQKVMADRKVKVMNDSRVSALNGDKMLSAIKVQSPKGEFSLNVQGVFVEIGLVPNTEFAAILEKNASGEIKVDNRNNTSVPGIFAAGDVTDVPEKQIIIAAGEGSKAALSAFRYLLQQEDTY